MNVEPLSIAEATRILGTLLTTLSVLTGALFYWRGRIADETIKTQQSEKIKQDLLQIQSETSQLKCEIHSLKDSFSESFKQVFHSLGRLEGTINAQSSKNQ